MVFLFFHERCLVTPGTKQRYAMAESITLPNIENPLP
jgi:hypothetical protein